ncbi:uncharacterized protein LOC143604171 isoform X1 [Bidens hawaiensis]|uniref:uncharacterized protein LOC143604171 isoform X1 n=1 Tax=Bidens hawaiensis TaxID=980011 RepID=UPI0040491AC5
MADDVTRWTVTYTKHKTQKRKVYQDGFLELQLSSHKVKLYDDCDKLLESKIVKLDDAVRSGETITFGCYLVDIGDPDGETKPIPNTILQRDKIMSDRKGALNNKWDVMYTAQVTQKAKRFQDGVLKLTSSGSQGRQEATLLAEDGTQLSHRYLKLSEDITSGSSFNMTG